MRPIRIQQFVKEEVHIEWLIDGLLPNMGWTLLVGRQGCGKSTMALQMCCAIQQGESFLGLATQQAETLFIQTDSDTDEWRLICERISPESQSVQVVDVPSKCLDNPAYVQHLMAIAAKVKPGFIVFDSLYSLSSKPISTEAVLIPVNIMRQIALVDGVKVPFLLIHHPPHGEARAAGHHSLPANCSNEWFLSAGQLHIKKGRLRAKGEIPLDRTEEGLWIPVQQRQDKGKKGKHPLFDMEI